MKRLKHIAELQDAILQLHGATATYVESVPVVEKFRGKTVWDGIVEVFELRGHPKAPKAYAWTYETDNPKARRHVAVLHIPPVTSPVLAVRAAVVQEFRVNEQS